MRRRLLLIILFPWIACVDRVDFRQDNAEFPLIIEGLFSTDTAKVRLSWAYPANGGNYATRVSGATVYLTDLDAPTWRLDLYEEIYKGDAGFWRYQLFNGTTYSARTLIRPQEGHRYELHVTFGSSEFVSDPQLIRDPGSVDSIYYTYRSGFNRDRNAEEDGFDIYFDATVPVGEARYFQWKMRGTFSIAANPEAGPDRCWATEQEEAPVLSTTVSGPRYAGVLARYVPITFDRFNDRYRVEIRQYEVSREVWEFMEAVRFQRVNSLSIFQPPFYTAKGNVRDLHGKIPVIGIFIAALDASKVLYIRRADVPRPVFGRPLEANCLRVYPGSLVIQPPYWI